MKIRPAAITDLPACYEVCLGTGDSGADGHHMFSQPELLGDIYVAPYFEFCLDFGWVLVDDADQVQGYVLGCPDTKEFEKQLSEIWWPRMREKYKGVQPTTPAETECLEFIANPNPAPADLVQQFPAHGHIDLLPIAQGAGFGKAMMQKELIALKNAGASGMYLDVSIFNERALKFYERLGFKSIVQRGESNYLGLHF